MNAWIGAVIALAAGAWLSAASASRAAEGCEPAGKVSYLCGPANAEDMVLAPGADLMVVSGMAGFGGGTGQLYLVDAKRKTFEPVAPDLSGAAQPPYADCPGPPDLGKFAVHGLAMRPGARGRDILYAINHGGREAVEVMRFDPSGSEPKLRWIGCVVMPADVNPNSVAPTPEGGFVVSKFHQAGDPQAFAKMGRGEKTGAVYEWTPGKGYRVIPGSELSGPNGVAVSADGQWVLVAAWPERRVLRLSRDGSQPAVSVPVDFMPDNLRWAPDGQLLVAGQVLDLSKPTPGPHDWVVLKLDPASMKLTPVLRETGTAAFSDATGALQVGREVWVGTFRGDRLAYAPLD